MFAKVLAELMGKKENFMQTLSSSTEKKARPSRCWSQVTSDQVESQVRDCDQVMVVFGL